MIVLEQKLIAETKDSTASVLKHGGKFLGFTIEDGYRDVKVHGQTRIPPGVYDLIPISDDLQGKLKLLSFAKREWKHEFILYFGGVTTHNTVLYHWGNFVSETEGCPLINATLGFDTLKNVYQGGGSREQYKQFYRYIATYVKAGEKIKVKVTR